MLSLSVSTLLVCACVEVLHAQFWTGLHSPMPMGGLSSFDDTDDDMSMGEPLLLNCFSSFKDATGNLDNELAVTIEPRDNDDFTELRSFGGGMGGLGNYHGGFGRFGGALSMSSNPRSSTKLSARIELFSATKSGPAFVVFTERARVDSGCSVENFGSVITRDSLAESSNIGQGLGMGGGGFGFGYGGHGYPGLGFGGQLGYGSGFGYPGYAGGLGSVYGVGMGIGAGFGMGTGMGLFPGQDLPSDGVVTELSVTQGALTTAVVDDVGFDDLSDLAGRGLLICSDVTYDWDWKPVCTEPFFSCCALKFDNVGLTLVS